MSNPVRHCDFYRYCASAVDDPDAYVWVHSCCGGPWEERSYGHYAGCPESPNRKETPCAACVYTDNGWRPCGCHVHDLIESSSLGTPAAKAFRESVSDEDVDHIMERVNEMDDAMFRRAPKRESYGDGPIKPHAARAKYGRRKHHRK